MINAKVIADSVSPIGIRLTTLEVTFPRFILAEMNTHRVFSRNSASSRAVPIKKKIEEVRTNPVIPIEFGKNRPGMSASEEIPEAMKDVAIEMWRSAAENAADWAAELADVDVHKQVVNRVLEPFLWHTALITSTEWDNFFQQRLSPLAQPEMRVTAEAMKAALDRSTPDLVRLGEYHLPFISCEDAHLSDIDMIRCSVARCARVSYLTHDGKRDIQKDLELADRLEKDGHWSPFEHVAVPLITADYARNFCGWFQYRAIVDTL